MFRLSSSAQLHYTLTYKDSSDPVINIAITPSVPLTAPLSFVMPRSIPGGYGIYIYDNFIEQLYAMTTTGEKILMTKDKDDAPRWYCSDTGKQVSRITYQVNLDKMERKMTPADASVIRPGFAGILNYSLLGWVDGKEQQPVQFTVETFPSWAIFSTQQPTSSPATGSLTYMTDNYYTLADGQLFIGYRFRVKEFKGLVPLYVVSYCQTGEEYLDDYGTQGINSMGILKDYFGDLPFQHYSIMLRKVVLPEPGNAPALAMEHLESSTFFGDTSGARTKPMSKEQLIRTMPTYLHHMGHALLPLRCYGDSYRPYVMEIPPIINNIWFNEGFMWFLPYDTLKLQQWKATFTRRVYSTSSLIKKLSLSQLSQLASTAYGNDFRIGSGIYSRGALMAIEMNDYIKEKTGGRRSMKDVFRYLYNWSKQNKRAFTMDEFPQLINKACGVDLDAIYKKWQLPIE